MAGTVKEAKNGKKRKRLKRSIRKTLGALFMATALVVAAIPVDNLQAAGEDNVNSTVQARDRAPSTYGDPVHRPDNDIPTIDKDTKIYTSGDKIFRFAYIQKGGNYIAVLLGYDNGYLAGKSLEIPDAVDAYEQYTINLGTEAGYAAVGRNGNFLFYKRKHEVEYVLHNDNQVLDSNGNLVSLNNYLDTAPEYRELVRYITDKDGNRTGVVIREEYGDYIPCYLDSKSEWEDIDREKLYYDKNKPTGGESITGQTDFARTNEQQYQRITNAEVGYIGKQYLEKVEETTPTGLKKEVWRLAGDVTDANPDKGVFANASNLVELSMGEKFRGIGNYAFYGSGIRTLKLENGLDTIAEGAFQDCIQLQNVSLDLDCPLKALGAYAFKGCVSLGSFALPWSVVNIGDSAFENCTKLYEVNLCSEGKDAEGTGSNLLSSLGYDVFKNCELLQSVTFPSNCSESILLSTFAGCSSLQFIGARNERLTFVEDTIVNYGYDQFKAMLGEGTKINGEFFFEGFENSELHKLAREKHFAFSYLTKDDRGNYIRQDRYEITEPDVKGGSGQNTYVVTSQNNLFSYTPEGNPDTIVIPTKIGPHSIYTFDPAVFSNRCNLRTVVIPNTVTEIGERAFQGCHNLEDVIFDSYENSNVVVGQDAFKTQSFTGNHNGDSSVSNPPVELHFTGPISSGFGPYNYAMNEANAFTSGNQQEEYITYYSGWPQNLEVKYNKVTKKSELVDFPALSELGASKYSSATYKYLAVPGGDNAYETAISNAYSEYVKAGYNLSAMTPNQREVISNALDITIPEGVQSIREGLFREKERLDSSVAQPVKKTVTAQSLISIDSPRHEVTDEQGNKTFTYPSDLKQCEFPGTFAGCENLTSITLNSVSYADGSAGGLTEVGDHAFLDCTGLTQAALPVTLEKMGVTPFLGCKGLSFVNFQNNPNFACEKSIIFGPAADGTAKGKLVECLQGRTQGYVENTELAGVTELGKEAFKGTNVFEVDLSDSTMTTVPTGAFADTPSLNRVLFPYTLNKFENDGFTNSNVNYIAVKSTSMIMAENNAFDGMLVDRPSIAWRCAEDTPAEDLGRLFNFDVGPLDVERYYKVVFRYWDNEAQKEVQLDSEEQYSSVSAVVFPQEVGTEIEKDGEKLLLSEWKLSQTETTWFFTAEYVKPQWKVTFVDPEMHFDPIEIWVENGGNAMNNATIKELLEKVKEFGITGFKSNDGDLTQVTKDLTATADYGTEHTLTVQGGTLQDGSTSGSFEAGTKIIIIADEPKENEEFSTWSSLPDLSATTILNKTNPQTVFTMPNEDIVVIAEFRNINNGSGDGPDNSRSHVLTVRGGSGSGTYKTGEQVIITADPAPEGQSFNEWTFVPSTAVLLDKNKAETVITMPDSNVTVMSNYKTGGGNGNGDGDDNNPGASPNPGPSSEPGSNKMYSLIVHNGNNSGSYLPGQQIIVVADDPPAGQQFSSWTVSPAATVVTDKSLSAIVVTMPEYDVALVANYKAIPTGSGNTTGSSNTTGTSNNTSTNRPSGSGSTNGGTSVIIDKNGLSNTGVVQVTVNGSSDNFVIKITENSAATEAVLKALLAEYGNLDKIKYVPMDISLYDSTGTRKITDTSGLSITITLPIPDSLIPYAGNNKVAGVVSDRLDKLSPKFTTINGVSCVTFTADHFSPYVIYVDTGNVSSSGTVSDSTPKTGDGIHPKWFLSIGLASLSFVMFMQKDNNKKSKKKQKVAVRAR